VRRRCLPFFFYVGITFAACTANPPRFAFTLPGGTINATSLAVDSHGNTYLAGGVVGNTLTATPGAFQPQNAGGTCYASGGFGTPVFVACANAFVVKLDPSGTVVFATYLGGTGNANPSAIAADSQGNVYVAGSLQGGFPVTAGAAFTDPVQADVNGFVAKLNASGTQLEYATSSTAQYGTPDRRILPTLVLAYEGQGARGYGSRPMRRSRSWKRGVERTQSSSGALFTCRQSVSLWRND